MLLRGILNGDTTTNIEPATRKEAYLKAILENGGGGGGGGSLPSVTSADKGDFLRVDENGEWDKDTGDDLARIDGYYETMGVGFADQLNATSYVVDKEPYSFRTAGGSADIASRLYDKIVGGTLAWNQIMPNGNFANAGSWYRTGATLTAENNVGTFTCNTTQYRTWGAYQLKPVPIGHIVLVKASMCAHTTNPLQKLRLGTHNTYKFTGLLGNREIEDPANDTWYDVSMIAVSGHATPYVTLYAIADSAEEVTVGDTLKLRNVTEFDLTLMFGNDVAEYIYSLEQGNAGDGVGWFNRLFPRAYYATNDGTLEHVNTSAHKTVGFNAFDRTTGKATLLGGRQYEITGTYTALSYVDINGDSETLTVTNGKFTPTNNGELTVTGGDGTTCVHLVWSGYRDGDYEEYKGRTYVLDEVVLPGIPKLDASNNLYYDGDTYESDGTVTRGFNKVDLGRDLNWFYDSGSQIFWANLVDGALESRNDGICSRYAIYPEATQSTLPDKGMMLYTASSSSRVMLKDTTKNDTDLDNHYASWLEGVTLLYKAAATSATSREPYQSPQVCDDFGTEEYIDRGVAAGTRDVAIPVGHETRYPANLRDKLQHLPGLAEEDGEYVVQQDGQQMTLVPLAETEAAQGMIRVITPLYVNLTQDSETTAAANYTNGEIAEAMSEGRRVYVTLPYGDNRLIGEITQVTVGEDGEGNRLTQFFVQMLNTAQSALYVLESDWDTDESDNWDLVVYALTPVS